MIRGSHHLQTERKFRNCVLRLGNTGDTERTSVGGFKFGTGVRGTERGSNQGLETGQ